MRQLGFLLLAGVAAAPALAQQHDHQQQPSGQAAHQVSREQPDPHADHAMPEPSPDPHAGHAVPEQEPDPHAGHSMPEQSPDPHAGHSMPAQPTNPHEGHGPSAAAPPVLPPPPAATSGPAHAADAIFGESAMAASRETLRREHGDMSASKLLIDKLELRHKKGRNAWHLDGQAWFGGDIDKFWLKGELEGDLGRKLEHAEVQALWSHAIDPWFDLQTGVRYDPGAGKDRTHLVLGVQGLAPYWWEVDGALFLSTKGELTARVEAEYDLRITQQLILQPQAELNLSAQRVEELGLGSGLTTAEVALRLRYQVSPTFAPYVGLSYERAFGATRRFREAEGDRGGEWGLLTGLRFWF